jgi:Subtilase family
LRLAVIGCAGGGAARLRTAIEELGLEVSAANDEGPSRAPRVLVQGATAADALRLERLPGVRWVEPTGRFRLNNATTTWVVQTNIENVRGLWDRGLRGEEQVIGHIDGAIDMDHCFFRDSSGNTPGPSHRKVVGLRNADGGTIEIEHGTGSAGTAAGEDEDHPTPSTAPNQFNGHAPRSKLSHSYLGDLDSEGGSSTIRQFLDAAHADGARVHTNSWDQSQGSAYTQTSVDVDSFTWDEEEDLVVFSGQNDGSLLPPATAKNVLVVNSCKQAPHQDEFASGSLAFTTDGRRKPDLVAPGHGIISAKAGTPCETAQFFGASSATPAVAGAAALVRQYYMQGFYPTGTARQLHRLVPTGALLKATLINATVPMSALYDYPGASDDGIGWGRLLLEQTLHFDGLARKLKLWDVRHERGLEHGEEKVHQVRVESGGEPLKITLVWTDPPGQPLQPFVNDLDLSMVSPAGQIFLGNHFENGESAMGGEPDGKNTVEMLLVNQPAPGQWQIRVRATIVDQGKPHAHTSNPCQGYALVVSGAIVSGPCFVASAVYGDAAHPDLDVLREWRDRHLAMDRLYQRFGPPLAVRVERHPWLGRALRRLAFRPLVALLRRASTGGGHGSGRLRVFDWSS